MKEKLYECLQSEINTCSTVLLINNFIAMVTE